MKRYARLRAIGELCVPDNREPLYATESTARRRFLGRAELPTDKLEALCEEHGCFAAPEPGAPVEPAPGFLPLHVRYPAKPFVDVEMTNHIRKLCRKGKEQMELLAVVEARGMADAKKALDRKTGGKSTKALAKRDGSKESS